MRGVSYFLSGIREEDSNELDEIFIRGDDFAPATRIEFSDAAPSIIGRS